VNVSDAYREARTRRGFAADVAQEAAVGRLERLYEELIRFRQARSNALRRLLTHPEVPRGVYLWGGVGRGKSFLMDSFYSVVPVRRKTRIHFHEFMRAVHAELLELKGVENPLDAAALHIAQRFRLICFDEFHVSDIGDAMILERLLRRLFELGIVFVMTSNYRPDQLYPDGLHRDRVLPAIELINQRLDILNVDGGIDYRQRQMEQVDAYLTPVNADSEAALGRAFEALAETPDESPLLAIEAREIRALRRAGGIVWFDFATLCGGPRSQNDYLELASRFHTLVLSGVPQLSAGQSSEARRFTWLIDVLYDHCVKLIMSAEVAPEELYTAGALANEFQRTASRIREMQSADYLRAPRRPTLSHF
jgi:cell division protein ZapE